MSDQTTLFPVGAEESKGKPEQGGGVPRVARPVRNQVEILCTDLNSLVPEDHQMRTVWEFVEKSDLSAWYRKILAVEGSVGRTAIDPRILLSLWLYATLDGVGSARGLAKLCEEHVVYRWLCGGVSVNYHTLSDFRSCSAEELEGLVVEFIARLRAAGAVTLKRVAHDGIRVRASAGSGSFRRLETLERFREEAREQLEVLKKEVEQDPGAGDRRKQAAQERAKRERSERVEEALRQYPEVKAKKKHDKKEARVSTTDADARTMRMADGGFRPAYNVQLTADTGSQVIVNATTMNTGSDHGLLPGAVQKVEQACGTRPGEVLVDGGYSKPEDIEQLAKTTPPCTVYAPPTQFKDSKGEVIKPPADESAEIKAWRERMTTEAAKDIYKERAATIECANAQARNRGLQQFRVRGLKRVQSVVLLFAIAHNIACMFRLLKAVC
jgi:transposase